jgi:hypothetical protein
VSLGNENIKLQEYTVIAISFFVREAKFTSMVSRKLMPQHLRPCGFARALPYLSKGGWSDHARKSLSLARRMRLIYTLALSFPRARPTFVTRAVPSAGRWPRAIACTSA